MPPNSGFVTYYSPLRPSNPVYDGAPQTQSSLWPPSLQSPHPFPTLPQPSPEPSKLFI